MNEFGKNLRLLREAHGLTGDQIAAKLGIGHNMVGRYERGEVQPTLSKLCEIADYFGVTLDGLVGREDKSGSPSQMAFEALKEYDRRHKS